MTNNLHPQYQLTANHDDDGDDPGTNFLAIERPTGTCYCGCGQATTAKSNYRQGHDQRLRSAYLHAYRNGIEVGIYDGGMLRISDPETAAANDNLEMTFTHRSARKAKQVKLAKAKAKAPQADADIPGRRLIGQVFEIKIGRWPYKATVVDYRVDTDTYDLEYERKGGKLERITRAASIVQALVAQ